MSYLVGSSTQKFIFLLTVKIHIDHGLGMLTYLGRNDFPVIYLNFL